MLLEISAKSLKTICEEVFFLIKLEFAGPSTMCSFRGIARNSCLQMFFKMFYLHSLQGNIPSVLVHMIYTYIQQIVLATKSSHIKVPSSSISYLSLIDGLVFKQQKTTWVWNTHGKNDSLTRKFIKNYMVVTSLVKHTPSPSSILKHSLW